MTRRGVLAVLSVAALAAYAWLAVLVFRSKQYPESFRAWDGELAWIVGPPAKSLLDAADTRIEQALAALNDTTRSPAERLDGHRAHLKVAEELLIRGLRAQPAQPAALARLAAVRWELTPPVNDHSVARGLELIDLASQLAPDAPRVQVQLGELLVRAGRIEDAEAHLRKAVELDPASARRAVAALRTRFIPAARIVEVLPAVPEVLVELKGAFAEDGNAAGYLAAVDPLLESGPTALLEAYGEAALASGDGARLAERMARLAESPDPAREGERRIQQARGLAAAGLRAEAARAARAACEAAPDDSRVVQRAGRVALSAGDPALALSSFRSALTLAARTQGGKVRRATLYREIGQAQDALGRPDLAYKAYLQALRLQPSEGVARARVDQLEKAAGVR